MHNAAYNRKEVPVMEITPYTRMVFYHETDRMDIVNHSNYIHMAEEARVDFMERAGIMVSSALRLPDWKNSSESQRF